MDWCGECFFRKRPTTRITGLNLEELLIFSLLDNILDGRTLPPENRFWTRTFRKLIEHILRATRFLRGCDNLFLERVDWCLARCLLGRRSRYTATGLRYPGRLGGHSAALNSFLHLRKRRILDWGRSRGWCSGQLRRWLLCLVLLNRRGGKRVSCGSFCLSPSLFLLPLLHFKRLVLRPQDSFHAGLQQMEDSCGQGFVLEMTRHLHCDLVRLKSK